MTVLTLAGAKASKALGSSESSHSMAGGTKKRWAMVIDLKKCHEQADCHDCVKACHLYHNVPDYGNRKDEIKWIWKENFHHAFHEQEHHYLEKDITETVRLWYSVTIATILPAYGFARPRRPGNVRKTAWL